MNFSIRHELLSCNNSLLVNGSFAGLVDVFSNLVFSVGDRLLLASSAQNWLPPTGYGAVLKLALIAFIEFALQR